MARLVKKKSNYYAVFYDRDRRPKEKWVTLRTRNKEVARTRLVRYEKREATERYDPWYDNAPVENMSVAVARDAYMKERKKSDRSPRTLRSDESILELFIRSLPEAYKLHQVERGHVERFLHTLRKKGRASSTLSTYYYTRLKHFFKWCIQEGWLKVHPMRRMKKPKVGRKAPLFFSTDDYRTIIQRIEADAAAKKKGLVKGQKKRHVGLQSGAITWLADVVRIAVGTGMRVTEICHMQWHWVDLRQRTITIRAGDGFRPKSHHERMIPFGSEVAGVLERLHAERSEGQVYVFDGIATRPGVRGRLDGTYVSKWFKKYVVEAGLNPDNSFHTHASWMVMADTDLYVVKELLGHASIGTTQRYAHLAPSRLRAAVDRVFAA